jgi:hypothetical protein
MREEQEEQSPNLPVASPLRDQIASALQEMTNTEKDVKNFKLFLMNQSEDEAGNISKMGEPLLNEDGIRKVMGEFTSVVTTHYMIMDTTEDAKFNKNIDYVNESITTVLLLGKNSFGIKSPQISNLINTTFMQHVNGVMGRGAGERPFWTKITMDYNIHSQPQKKPGMLAGLFKGKE